MEVKNEGLQIEWLTFQRGHWLYYNTTLSTEGEECCTVSMVGSSRHLCAFNSSSTLIVWLAYILVIPLIHECVVHFGGLTGHSNSQEVEVLPTSEPLTFLFVRISQHELVDGVCVANKGCLGSTAATGIGFYILHLCNNSRFCTWSGWHNKNRSLCCFIDVVVDVAGIGIGQFQLLRNSSYVIATNSSDASHSGTKTYREMS